MYTCSLSEENKCLQRVLRGLDDGLWSSRRVQVSGCLVCCRLLILSGCRRWYVHIYRSSARLQGPMLLQARGTQRSVVRRRRLEGGPRTQRLFREATWSSSVTWREKAAVSRQLGHVLHWGEGKLSLIAHFKGPACNIWFIMLVCVRMQHAAHEYIIKSV